MRLLINYLTLLINGLTNQAQTALKVLFRLNVPLRQNASLQMLKTEILKIP